MPVTKQQIIQPEQLPKSLLSITMEHAADEVFLLRPDGSVAFASRSTLARRGFSIEQLYKMHVWEWNAFVTEASWARRWESLKKLKKTRFETVHRDSSGETFKVDIQAYLIDINAAPYCLCFVNDLSKLAQRVDEMSERENKLLIAQAQADIAIKTLEESQDKKELIFATIAHELRTPVASIAMLATESTTEEWTHARADVVRLTRQLLHSIDDMRRLTREGHKRNVQSERFKLGELLHSVSLAVSAYSTKTRTKIDVTLDDHRLHNDLAVSADLYRVRVILTNIIKNACTHSGSDRVSVSVSRTTGTESDQPTLCFNVRDWGRGISPDQIEQLFAPYTRGDTEAEGSGLGLHIAREWIEEIGGNIEYQAADPGSIFTLHIPCDLPDFGNESQQTEAGNKPKPTQIKPLDILFVEDERVLRMVSEKMLRTLGHNVTLARDGTQGLDEFRKQHFDLVITDYFMPDLDGLGLISALREEGFTGPIYGCTAATLGDEFDAMLDTGADYVFSKPLTGHALTDRLMEEEKLMQTGKVIEPEFSDNQEELIQAYQGTATLLINLENGELHATKLWRIYNQIPQDLPMSNKVLHQTVAGSSLEKFKAYSASFFKQPIEAPPMSVDLQLKGLAGKHFDGRVTSFKKEINDELFAVSQLELLSESSIK